MHHHKSEHWVVVKGTAKVRIGDKEVFVHEMSQFMFQKALHRLENPGKISLEIIEVQVGEYVEEDNIIRFDDIYGKHDFQRFFFILASSLSSKNYFYCF